ncbi:MAG: hypothetical protein JO060_06240, partial [Candidatus Eremiobacteraeota bacterium]|nr:hypothetical protein [Candidatus Eremiobacteraeota bacterium]
MMRVDLRYIGVGAFIGAIVLSLASCNGGSSVSTNPTSAPTTTPTGPPTVTPSLTPPPTTPPTGVPTPTPTVTGADALIDFTGSFQFGPFTLDQFPNGVAIVTQQTGQTRQIVPMNLVNTFFHDLAQNLPVNKIPVAVCPKPTTAPTDETL